MYRGDITQDNAILAKNSVCYLDVQTAHLSVKAVKRGNVMHCFLALATDLFCDFGHIIWFSWLNFACYKMDILMLRISQVTKVSSTVWKILWNPLLEYVVKLQRLKAKPIRPFFISSSTGGGTEKAEVRQSRENLAKNKLSDAIPISEIKKRRTKSSRIPAFSGLHLLEKATARTALN